MDEETPVKLQNDQQSLIQDLPPEVKAAQTAEQKALMAKIKSTDEIKKQVEAQLKDAASSKGASVAAALLNSFQPPPPKPKGPKEIRTFEVMVYEEDIDDNTGNVIQKIANHGKPDIIKVSSPAELQERLNLYRQCGQIPKVRMIGDPEYVDENGKPITKDQADSIRGINHANPSEQSTSASPVIKKTLPPKYYKIGGIDVKDDNGKIYQKQWMKLSESEAKNIRIVNDKTNGIVNLNGKHIEMMKWILVENADDDSATAIDNALNEQ